MCRSSFALLLLTASCLVTQGEAQVCGGKGNDDTTWGGTPNNRIVNGQKATPGEWKWQVSLREGGHFCGGTLIADRWVFTAAHCLDGSSILSPNQDHDMKVVTGDFKRRNDNSPDDAHAAEYEIEQGWMHPSYNSDSTDHDFALIKLKTSVVLNENTGYACLPEAALEAGVECWITGWGTLRSGGSWLPNFLMEAPLTMWENSVCNSGANYNGGITDAMVCGQAEGKTSGYTDACQGDSGGPLVCEDANGKWVLHGATSWGNACGRKKYPGVYARVYSVMDWVDTIMAGDAWTTTPLPLPSFPEGKMWMVQQGACNVDKDGCIQSPGYSNRRRSNKYGENGCLIRVQAGLAVPVSSVSFSTEYNYDFLFMDGNGYSGRNTWPDSITPVDPIEWKPDSSLHMNGWKICPDGPPKTCDRKKKWSEKKCRKRCDRSKCHKKCNKYCSAGCSCNDRKMASDQAQSEPRFLSSSQGDIIV